MYSSSIIQDAEDKISTALILLSNAHRCYLDEQELPHHHELTASEAAIKQRLLSIELAMQCLLPNPDEDDKARMKILFKGVESGTR